MFFFLLASSLPAAHVVYQKSTGADLLAVDASGNLYATTGLHLAKYDSGGNPIYTATLPVADFPYGMTVDRDGNVILVGSTNSDALPTGAGVFQPQRNPGVCIAGDKSAQRYRCPDAYILKLDRKGNLAWASYLGGIGIEVAYSVATDSKGDIYVSGLTLSPDFPRVKPFQAAFGGYADAFLTKVSGDGASILYSSTLGGVGYDRGLAVAVDEAGNAYLGGELQGNAPVLRGGGFAGVCGVNGVGSIDGFLAKVSPNGDRLVFGGCLNDGGSSAVTSIVLDRQGNIYIGGNGGKNFPATAGAFHRPPMPGYTDFLQKMAGDGSAVLYSAVFPGGSFGVSSIAVDSSGSAYLAGQVDSSEFPIIGPAMQPCPGEAYTPHAFLLQLSADGSSALYSSFSDGGHVALAPDGALYVGGNTLRKLTALAVPGDSFLAAGCVLHAATLASHLGYGQPGISPGEIVALKGTGLGPPAAADLGVVEGLLPTSLGGTEVLFDGIPAPLLYVQDSQINVVAPYELAGRSTTSIQVRYQGRSTEAVNVPVSALSPALFRNADGSGLVLNNDYSANSTANPVARGKIFVLYTTGAGQTNPASGDGQIWRSIGGLEQPVAARVRNYSSSYGTVTADAPVLYAGPVPGLVSGVQQFNVLVPAELPDSFVTEKFSAGTVVILEIGGVSVSASVYVK